jgi:hypothetical protein
MNAGSAPQNHAERLLTAEEQAEVETHSTDDEVNLSVV